MTLFGTSWQLALMNSTVGTSIAAAGIGFGLRHRLDRPARWLLVWLIVDAIASVAGSFPRIQFRNNQYVAQSWYPLSAGLALCLLASTLTSPRARRAVDAMAWGVALTIIGLTIWVEKFGSFARFTGVIHGVTLLLVGAAIVLHRARKARGDMFADPVFLTGAAFVMMGVPSPFLAIGVTFLGKKRTDLHDLLYTLKAVLAIGSYCLTVWAFQRTAQRRQPRAEDWTR